MHLAGISHVIEQDGRFNYVFHGRDCSGAVPV
jgi:hypothetical protein